MKIKQIFCIHWFDSLSNVETNVYYGVIVNCEQKEVKITREIRKCSKCNLIDSREIDCEYLGWS